MANILSKRCLQTVIAVTVPAYLAGCMVGPDYHAPCCPTVKTYNASPLSAKTVSAPLAGSGGKSQQFVNGQDIPGQWWDMFHSPQINNLIQTGLANSPNMAAAQATLKEAQQTLYAQIGSSLLPTVDSMSAASRQRSGGAAYGGNVPSDTYNLYNVSIGVTYTFDIFGGARREIESLQAQVDYQQFELIATYLTLTSNIVTTAITIASDEEQIAATNELITAEQAQLNIMQKQLAVGGIADTNVLTQQTLVDQARATLPPLEKSLDQAKDALAVLIGDFPNQPMPDIHLEQLNLPPKLPVSLPAYIVRQRPDVRASEALLHSASAQIGVATANLLPQISLSTTSFSWASSAPATLFNPASQLWSWGAQLTQPIFHGGALLAQRKEAIDAYDSAAAQYRETVLQAYQNVADSLRAIDMDARTFQADRTAEIAAYKTLQVTEGQYRVGGVSYLNLLTAQQQYEQTRITRIQAQATRYADTVALFQALGGGWWNYQWAKPCFPNPVNPTQATLCKP